eukprot:TRINITY_DN3649_c0_g1_i1.p1 TRINITY_DN3649_c0_g1~~TRINITY_DN3649_c0_g1_i1.p1  ORF type:complete len:327 (+),score=39.81 TRINITY_DN3649_c0_g1_i1:88-1068(+)
MADFPSGAVVTRCVVVFVGCCMPFKTTALSVTFQSVDNQSEHTSTCVVDGKPRRIAWLHAPKTGSSLGNLIAHYLRPDLPEDAIVPDCNEEVCEHVDEPFMNDIEFQYRYPAKTWFRNCLWCKGGNGPMGYDWFAHHQIGGHEWNDWEGSFVGMFRDPAQRALSSWDSFAKVFEPTLGKLLSKEQWARRIEGTVTKMLAGQEFPLEAHFGRSKESGVVPDVELALSRLDGFLFVGLVEHWALSVCLFHRITGSACKPHDMDNCRKDGNRDSRDSWATSELNGFVDRYDTKIYEAVKQRFWRDVESYQLTKESCHNTCTWFGADIFS